VSSVREFFSVTAGRLFARLADQRRDISALVAATVPNRSITDGFDALAPDLAADLEAGLLDSGLLDSVLIDVASLAGLWNESMVHGPAWRIGEIGRRLERVFGVIDVWRGAVQWAAMIDLEDDAQRLIEIVLATNESLVAYRRRYRSDVEFGAAVELVILDGNNPRSAASAIESVRREAEAVGWTDGATLAADLANGLQRSRLHSPVSTERALHELYVGCDQLARSVVSTFLASPVDPRPVGLLKEQSS
jgi:uncharacterized alpha-E superfamily protein